jgi:hypothetical protein
VSMPPLSASEARQLAFEAYTYGFAIVENYRAMFGMCVWRDSPQYSGFNNYLHGRTLFDSSYDTVVNANNDTLYSTTFADLRAEPIVISVPPTDSRYFVIQLVDMGTTTSPTSAPAPPGTTAETSCPSGRATAGRSPTSATPG